MNLVKTPGEISKAINAKSSKRIISDIFVKIPSGISEEFRS